MIEDAISNAALRQNPGQKRTTASAFPSKILAGVDAAVNVDERTRIITEYLRSHNYADISQLSDMLSVSDMTVRRDLDRLEEKNFLVRVHGGAKLATQRMYEPPLESRLKDQAEEKYKLGRYAASLVKDGDAIAIDSSSTTYAMLPYLNVAVTVITNHVSVATALAANEKAQVILLGGLLQKSSLSLSGKDMEEMMGRYLVDKAFLSSKALNARSGASDATTAVGEGKKVLMRSAKQTFFLFDHTKFNTEAFYRVCGLEDMENIIVDGSIDLTRSQQQLLEKCAEKGVMLHRV